MEAAFCDQAAVYRDRRCALTVGEEADTANDPVTALGGLPGDRLGAVHADGSTHDVSALEALLS